MKIRWRPFNLYLLVTLALAVSCGCQTAERRKAAKLLATLHLHLEVSRDGTSANEPVPIYRARPVMVNVDKMPFLTEGNLVSAKVVDAVGGFVLWLKFDHAGATVLEQRTTANRGRKIAVYSQFGGQLVDSRWLAAPVISRRITDGVLTFTPDATREEAEEIALGLNNVAKKSHTWIDR